MDPSIHAFGDRGALIQFHEPPSRELTERLNGISVAASRLPGVVDAAPGLTTVLIEFGEGDQPGITDLLPELLASSQPLSGVVHELPVEYNGEDFEWALSYLGLSAGSFIGLFGTPIYDVRLLGSPGFVYLSDVSPELAMPRLDTPRRHVAAGSIGIAGTQTGIYGRGRPGGWRIVATAAQIPQMRPGDRVRFVS